MAETKAQIVAKYLTQIDYKMSHKNTGIAYCKVEDGLYIIQDKWAGTYKLVRMDDEEAALRL